MKVITFYSDPPNSTYYSDRADKWIDSVKTIQDILWLAPCIFPIVITLQFFNMII